MGKVYLGIDGGGTKTSFAAIDENGKVLKTSRTLGTSIDTVSLEVTFERLKEGILNLGLSHYDGVGAGLGGVLSSSDKEEVKKLLRKIPGICQDTKVRVENDASNAFRSAFEKEGIVFIVGTGSLAIGQNVKGEVIRLGGYGYKEGDKGSGYFLGHEALEVLAHYCDQRCEKTSFIQALMDNLSIRSKEDLVAVYNRLGRAEVAALAPIVAQCHSSPDAESILMNGAGEFADLAHELVKG